MQRPLPSQFNIPEKANRVLNIILITMLLFVVRIWHLSVIQYDSRLEQSRKPQRRVVVEAARRATIRDRFNVPLAINNIQYNAAILYSQFKQIPSTVWTKDANGKRVKKSRRKEYITQLSQLLSNELQLDPERLEDLIHAKASFYYQVPFVIKEDITEKEYYRLKMLEKDWVGIQVQRLPKRTYPMGKVGADIIGYMGAINRQEYEGVIREIKILEQYLKEYEAGETPELPKGLANNSQVRLRHKELLERAYTVNDYLGKTGIENRFEETLRGYQGKKSYYSDARGNFLRELPGSRDPTPGKRLLLTISSELQELAEQILIQNESIREAYLSGSDMTQQILSPHQPWMKGGAIVAIEPNNGEVLAMASYPRYDPNDFIVSGNPEISAAKKSNILKWFETEDYLAEIWDQKRQLEREMFDPLLEKTYEDGVLMTWDAYLRFILPQQHIVRTALKRVDNVKNSVDLLQAISTLLTYSGQSDIYWLFNILYKDTEHQSHGKRLPPDVKQAIESNLDWHANEVAALKTTLDHYVADIPHDYDKALLIDLCRLIVNEDRFSNELLKAIGNQNLAVYRDASAAMASVSPIVRTMSKTLFHDIDFKEWRQKNEKDFLKQKRAEEKLADKYPKPYIDYIDQMETKMFQEFWNKNRWDLLLAFLSGQPNVTNLQAYNKHFLSWEQELQNGAHQEVSWKPSYDILKKILSDIPTPLAKDYLHSLRTFQDLNRPILGHYSHLRRRPGHQLEKDLATAFYPAYGYGHSRSYAYRQASTQGSIFKLTTAYAALTQRYNEIGNPNIAKKDLNPFTITDSAERMGKDWIVGYHMDGKHIPQLYKGGRLPRSHARGMGKVDFLRAMEVSSNPYFSLLAGDYLKNPDILADAAKSLSYGSRTGIELSGEIPGRVPDDLKENRTGLYAMAIGQHSLVVTPLQSSVMIAAIANGGKVLKPQIVRMSVGAQRSAGEDKDSIAYPQFYPYQDSLAMVGIDFPLFTATCANSQKSLVTRSRTEVVKTLFMPAQVREMLLDGMDKASSTISKPNLSSLTRLYRDYPEAISDFIDVKDSWVGKTSTAEALENFGLDLEQCTNMYTHIWFGGISFDDNAEPTNTFIFKDEYGQPELVVVVYLRFGKYGKDAAPLAAQVVKKWRDIKLAHKREM